MIWTNWSLEQWLHDLENRHHQEIQLDLDRIQQVAQHLDLRQPAPCIIHVAGTNGKGSTVGALEAIYLQAGYRVGSYTSPHLIHFNERVKIDGEGVSDASLCQAFAYIEAGRGDISLTYFEMVTLAAFYLFKQAPLDILILEVGLGGRLDATNIVHAQLAIITTIDFDHQDFLGNTLDAIAYEKAGIVRENQSFIYADSNPPQTIVDRARALNTDFYCLDQDYTISQLLNSWQVKLKNGKIFNLSLTTVQTKAAAAAVVATQLLQEALPVSVEAINKALTKLTMPGRLQKIEGEIAVIFDVAHNPQAARLLAEYLEKQVKPAKIHAVFSALKDKDAVGVISPLKDCVQHWYPAQLDCKRAASAELLIQAFKQSGIIVPQVYANPLAAFDAAMSCAKSGDIVVVYGSFYTVGPVMAVQTKIKEYGELL